MASKAISLTTKWRALKIFIPLVRESVHPEESKHSKQMNLLAYNHPMKLHTVELANNHKALLDALINSIIHERTASFLGEAERCLGFLQLPPVFVAAKVQRCWVGWWGGQNGAFGHCNSHNHSLPSQLPRASGMPGGTCRMSDGRRSFCLQSLLSQLSGKVWREYFWNKNWNESQL